MKRSINVIVYLANSLFGVFFMGRYHLFLCAASMLLLVSCESIPEGTPPTGEIVKAKPQKETYSIAAAENLLVNEITMKLVTLPAKGGMARRLAVYIPPKSSPLSPELAGGLMKKLKKTGLAADSANGNQEYLLYSSISEDGQYWICGIYQADGKKLLWSKTLTLEKKTSESK